MSRANHSPSDDGKNLPLAGTSLTVYRLKKKVEALEEELSLLEKKTRSKLDYLLKEIQQLRKAKN